jgi:hypothetical protein
LKNLEALEESKQKEDDAQQKENLDESNADLLENKDEKNIKYSEREYFETCNLTEPNGDLVGKMMDLS